MKKEKAKIKVTWPSFIIVMILAYLIIQVSIDAFIVKPKVNSKVNKVTEEYYDLKTHLDIKIPEIDSTLDEHTRQIKEQNKKLMELNNKISETVSD